MKEKIRTVEELQLSAATWSRLGEPWPGGRASALIQHMRPRVWKTNPRTGLEEPVLEPIKLRSGKIVDPFERVDEDEIVHNLITNAGRIQLHKAGYDTTGLPTNGFNYVALSNDTVTETASSTTLSNEITGNGLARAQGSVTLPTGSGNQTTIAKTFTATGTQSAQKAALFDASSSGDMNHVLGFTQRNLITNDTLAVTYTITLG